MEAAHLLLLGDVVLQVAPGDGAGPRGVGGHVDLVEAQLLQQVKAALELGFSLAAEANDDVGGEGGGGDDVADAVHPLQVLLDSVAAAHAGEDVVVGGLDGDVEVLADLGEVGHGADDAFGHVTGVGGEEADTPQLWGVVDGGEQVGEVRLVVQIFAVGLDGLAQEGDLAHAVGTVGCDLAGDIVDGAGALAAAAVGDDAVGAELIAAVDDGDEGGGAFGLGEGVGPELAAQVGVGHEVAEDDLEALGSGPDVDVGEAGAEVVRAGADHAAHNGDLEGRLTVAFLFHATEAAQVAGGAVLRLLADDAGVDDGEIGVLRPGGLLPAELGEAGGELVGVGHVHLAAFGPDVVSHGDTIVAQGTAGQA